MKNRGLAFWLSFILLFSMTGFAFADTEEETTQTEPVKIEKEVEQPTTIVEQPKQEETQKEEIKNEEPQKEEVKLKAATITTEQLQKNEVTKEEEKTEEVIETEKVTVQFQVMRENGNYANAYGSSSVVIKKGETGSKTYTINANDKRNVSMNDAPLTYIYLGTWGNGKYDASATGKIKLDRATVFNEYKKDGQKEVYITVKADYNIISNKKFTFNAIGKITTTSNNWEHQWTNSENNSPFTGYSWNCDSPKNIPNNYEFRYWKNLKTEHQYTSENPYHYSASELREDTIVDIYAFYQPIVTINYYDEDGTYLSSSTGQEVDIYAKGNAPEKQTKFLGWYEEKQLVPEDTVKTLPLTMEEVQTEFDVYAKYEPTPDPVPTPDPEPPIVTPDKPDTKVVTKTKTNNTITYYGMGDGTVSTPETVHTVLPTTKTPFTAPAETGAWAFLNLLTVLANFVVCIFLLLMAFINNRKEDDETEVKNRMLGRICTLIIAIVSGIIFLFTEDMSLPMVWVDQWTILMICTFVLQLIVGFLSRHKEEEIEQEHE